MVFWALFALAAGLGFVLGRYLLPPQLHGLVRHPKETECQTVRPDPGGGWSDPRGEYEVTTGTLYYRPYTSKTWRPVAELPFLLDAGGYSARFNREARKE